MGNTLQSQEAVWGTVITNRNFGLGHEPHRGLPVFKHKSKYNCKYDSFCISFYIFVLYVSVLNAAGHLPGAGCCCNKLNMYRLLSACDLCTIKWVKDVFTYTIITNLMHYYLFVKYYSPLHVSSIMCLSSGGHSCIQAAYGTVTLYKSPGGLLIRS